eukprot:1880374-Rhodomonas_salina.1
MNLDGSTRKEPGPDNDTGEAGFKLPVAVKVEPIPAVPASDNATGDSEGGLPVAVKVEPIPGPTVPASDNLNATGEGGLPVADSETERVEAISAVARRFFEPGPDDDAGGEGGLAEKVEASRRFFEPGLNSNTAAGDERGLEEKVEGSKRLFEQTVLDICAARCNKLARKDESQ